jgi:hypothetical protein
MNTSLDPFSFVVTTIAGWINRDQQQIIEYLMEDNRVLREQIGSQRLRFSDDQRRRLAAKAKKLSRKLLAQRGNLWVANSQLQPFLAVLTGSIVRGVVENYI